MTTTLRRPTLATLGLGGVLDVFRRGELPADAGDLVERIFGPADDRGAMVISGAEGIVGSGKTMQLGSRLEPWGVPLVALDLPSAPDGLGDHWDGLVRAFGHDGADRIMQNVVRMNYDGERLPERLDAFRPRFLLEAIPEVLELKRSHYEIFRDRYPGIEIRSVTSGFPSSELGVGIAHPAYPHEINTVWEVVSPEDDGSGGSASGGTGSIEAPDSEPFAVYETSDPTRLFWSLGLIPVPVSDDWSFVLDVLFCGVTLAGLRYHDARNMPYWKIDKHVRKLLGPNPFRAHDAIGAKGADYLTWSCLHHLCEVYGDLFRPTGDLTERKETGQNWYPPDHFRPVVDWKLEPEEANEFATWILGPLFQMTSLMLHEERAHLSHMNAMGELCAQFRRGILAVMREAGPEGVVETVEAYHELFPGAAGEDWHPEAVEAMDTPEWRQLYVNAEHDGTVGVVTIGREAYNRDVDAELNRALDWLGDEGIERVILTGDFHLSTQLVGADTSEFFPALDDADQGFRIARDWSRTARRLHDDFRVSVGFVPGKRCLGGMLELLAHCHYLVAVEDASLGFPEVSLPVVPGMEGCHWPFRKAEPEDRTRLLELLLAGRPVAAGDAVGWLVDAAGPLEEALRTAWAVASDGDHGLERRSLQEEALAEVPADVPGLSPAGSEATAAARQAIAACVRVACGATLADALELQARHSAEFMISEACRGGRVGSEYRRIVQV